MDIVLQNMKKIPKQARAIARVSSIIEATEALLKAGHDKDLSTTAIAKEAKIPIGSVYQYFESKDEILNLLYLQAFAEVNASVLSAAETNQPDAGEISFADMNRYLLTTFWKAASAHPTFRMLTRWHNRTRPLWEATPDLNSDLSKNIQSAFALANIQFPQERQEAVLRTMIVTISILVDQAVEESDEKKAEALIEEMILLTENYVMGSR